MKKQPSHTPRKVQPPDRIFYVVGFTPEGRTRIRGPMTAKRAVTVTRQWQDAGHTGLSTVADEPRVATFDYWPKH